MKKLLVIVFAIIVTGAISTLMFSDCPPNETCKDGLRPSPQLCKLENNCDAYDPEGYCIWCVEVPRGI